MTCLLADGQSGWGMDWGETWGGTLEAHDFEAEFRRLTWKHLEGLPNFQKLGTVMVELATETDANVIVEANRVGIDQAVGAELDAWGAMVTLPRLGAGDELYRRGIKAATIAILSQADPASIYDIVETVTPDSKILLIEQFPACFRIFFFNMTPDEQRIVGSLVGLCRGLGICALGVFLDTDYFEWASTEASVVVDHHWDSTVAGSVDPIDSAGFGSVRPL